MLRLLLVAAIACAGVACAENGGRPSTEQSATDPSRLVFLDSRIFDEELSASMWGKTPKITVGVPAGFSLNEIPERVDRWLYAVKESGGKVAAEPETRTRGLVGALIDVVVAIFEKLDEIRLYSPSEDYNATLLYSADGMVTKIVFERR